MNEQTVRFRLGLFVVFSGLVLLGLLLVFGGVPTFFTAHSQYIVLLPEAAGVGAGTPVRRSGVPIGEVKLIELDEETGQVRLTIEVLSKYAPRRHEVPTLTRGIFGGDTYIDFVPELTPGFENSEEQQVPKKPANDPLPPGAELKGRVQPDVASSLNVLSKVAENLNRLVEPMDKAAAEIRVTARTWGGLGENLNVLVKTNEEKLVKTLDNVNETVTRFGAVFNDENQRNLSATLKNVRTASDSLDSLTKNTDALMRDSRETIKNVNGTLTKLDAVMVNLEKVTTPLAERSDSITRNLDESTDRLNKVLADVQQLVRGFGQGEGTLQRLLTDPSLYNNVDAFACGLAKLAPRLERILKDMEIFADKIARHPETLGVGGAVRPGSGLK